MFQIIEHNGKKIAVYLRWNHAEQEEEITSEEKQKKEMSECLTKRLKEKVPKQLFRWRNMRWHL